MNEAIKHCLICQRPSENSRRTRFCAYRSADVEVLNEHHALELNDKEVDELLQIVRKALQGVLADHVILAWAHLCSKSMAQSGLSSDLSERSACQLSESTDQVSNQLYTHSRE